MAGATRWFLRPPASSGPTAIVADFDADAESAVPAWPVSAARDWIRNIHGGGGVVAGARAAALFLAESCAIDSGLVALPFDLQARFRRQHPSVHFAPENSVCEHDRIITAGTTVQELEMLSRFIGATTKSSPAVHWFARRTGLVIPHDKQSDLSPIESQDPLVAKAQGWLRDHYWQPINLRELAAHFAVSERTLSRRFQTALNIAPHQFLIDVRIDAATRLLTRTQLSVAEVGSLVGYPDQRHFREIFAKRTGRSPAKFRKSTD